MTTIPRLRAALLEATAAAGSATAEATSQRRQIAARLKQIRDELGQMVASLDRGMRFEEELAGNRR